MNHIESSKNDDPSKRISRSRNKLQTEITKYNEEQRQARSMMEGLELKTEPGSKTSWSVEPEDMPKITLRV